MGGGGSIAWSSHVAPLYEAPTTNARNMYGILLKPIRNIPLNVDIDGCAVTLTTAHHYAGNIVTPRQGFREGAIVIYETS